MPPGIPLSPAKVVAHVRGLAKGLERIHRSAPGWRVGRLNMSADDRAGMRPFEEGATVGQKDWKD